MAAQWCLYGIVFNIHAKTFYKRISIQYFDTMYKEFWENWETIHSAPLLTTVGVGCKFFEKIGSFSLNHYNRAYSYWTSLE